MDGATSGGGAGRTASTDGTKVVGGVATNGAGSRPASTKTSPPSEKKTNGAATTNGAGSSTTAAAPVADNGGASDDAEKKPWSNGLWDFGTSKTDVCCEAFWMPCLLFAENVQRLSAKDEADRSAACFCGYTLALLTQAHGCLGGYYRGRLRENVGIEGSRVTDCCTHQFCCCCALIQESREKVVQPATVTTQPTPSKTASGNAAKSWPP